MNSLVGRRSRLMALAFLFLALPFFHGSFLFDPYTETKWILLNCVGCLLGLSFILERKSQLIISKPRKAISIGLTLLLTSIFLSTALNFPGAYREQLADWFTFVFLFLASYQIAKNTKEVHSYLIISNAIGSLPVVGLSLLQYYGLSHHFGVEDGGFPFSSFGQQNLLSEYLALSTLLGIYGSWRLKKWHAFCAVSAALNLAVLSLQYSRAATLAFGIAAAILFLKHGALRKPMLLVIGLAIIFTAPLTLSSRFPYPVPWKKADQDLQETKTINSRTRLIRWQNTLCMVRANPLGVGLGNYEFGYAPYQNCVGKDPESNASMVVRSPHNGYLELASEGGVLALFGLLVGLAAFGGYSLLAPRLTSAAPWSAILVFLSFDAVFAFPLENAVPFFFAALALGHYLAFQEIGFTYRQLKLSRLAFLCLLMPLVALLGVRIYSKRIEAASRASSAERQLACRLYPDNWRGCLQAIEAHLRLDKVEEAKHLALLSVKERKNLYPAMRYLALIEAQAGNIKEACVWAKKYEDLVEPETSSLPKECL